MSKKKLNFAAVEVMIIIAIIGLLIAIAIPSFVKARDVSRQDSETNGINSVE